MAKKGPVSKKRRSFLTSEGDQGERHLHGHAPSPASHELGSVLNRIFEQIEDAERSNQETLSEMLTHLDTISEQAKLISSREKTGHTDSVSRLKGQISNLSERIEIVALGRSIHAPSPQLDQKSADHPKKRESVSPLQASGYITVSDDKTASDAVLSEEKQTAHLNQDRLASLAEHFSPSVIRTGLPVSHSDLPAPAKERHYIDLEKRFTQIASKLEDTLDRRLSEMDERLEIANRFDDLAHKLDQILKSKNNPLAIQVLEQKLDSLTSFVQKAEQDSSRLRAIEIQLEKLIEIVDQSQRQPSLSSQQIEQTVEKVLERKAAQFTQSVSRAFEDNLTVSASLDRLEAIERAILVLNSERSQREKRTNEQLQTVERSLTDLSGHFKNFETRIDGSLEKIGQEFSDHKTALTETQTLITQNHHQIMASESQWRPSLTHGNTTHQPLDYSGLNTGLKPPAKEHFTYDPFIQEVETEGSLKDYVADFTAQLEAQKNEIYKTEADNSSSEKESTAQQNDAQISEVISYQGPDDNISHGLAETHLPEPDHLQEDTSRFTEHGHDGQHAEENDPVETVHQAQTLDTEYRQSILPVSEGGMHTEEYEPSHETISSHSAHIHDDNDHHAHEHGQHNASDPEWQEEEVAPPTHLDHSALFKQDMQTYRLKQKDKDDFLSAARQAAQAVSQRHKMNKSLADHGSHTHGTDDLDTEEQDFQDHGYRNLSTGVPSDFSARRHLRGRKTEPAEVKPNKSASHGSGSRLIMIIFSLSALTLSAAILVNELGNRTDKTSLPNAAKMKNTLDSRSTSGSASERLPSAESHSSSGRESGKTLLDRVDGPALQNEPQLMTSQLRPAEDSSQADHFTAEAQIRQSEAEKERNTESGSLPKTHHEHQSGTVRVDQNGTTENMPGLSVGMSQNPEMQSVLSDSAQVNQIQADHGPTNRIQPNKEQNSGSQTTQGASKPDEKSSSDQNGAPVLQIKKSDDLADQNSLAPENTTAEQTSLPLPPLQVGPYSLRLAASKGNSKAQFVVAMRLAEGKGINKDYKSAAEWLTRSATQSYAPAQYYLAAFYEKGQGVEKDIEKAKSWYKRSANNGNLKAMHNLGVLYANATDKQADYVTAAKWFTQAANHGLADSQYNLGILYKNGLGVPKDQVEAYKWFSLAADRGDAQSASQREQLKDILSSQDIFSAEQSIARWRVTPVNTSSNMVDQQDSQWDKATKTISADARILQIQLMLHKLGYDIGPADGQDTPKVRAAIQDFQKKNGLQPTGEFSPELLERLKAKAG